MANVNVPFGQLPPVIGITGAEIFPLDQAGTTKKATLTQAVMGTITTNFPATIEYVVDSGGATMSTGVKGYLEVPFNCFINYIDLYADNQGSVSVDIWKCTYDQFDAGITHPVVGDSILSGNYPTITVGTKARVNYGGAIAISATDVLAFDIRSVASIMRLTISIKVFRATS